MSSPNTTYISIREYCERTEVSMQGKYLMLISLDAVDMCDLNVLKSMPNFSKLMAKGVVIENVQSIYPTLTYPAHTTIVTGKYPKNHKIINNTKLDNGDYSPLWYWYRTDVLGETLYDVASRANLKTCSLLWPVTGGAKITYNMPEIFPVKPYQKQGYMSLEAGSKLYQYDLHKRFGSLREGKKQPQLDNFLIECATYTLKKYKPDIMMLHLLDLDTHKHVLGTKHPQLYEVLQRLDDKVGRMVQALDEEGMLKDTVIALVGDHSQIDTHTMIKLNSKFHEKGWLQINEDGEIVSYDVIAKSCDGSTYVYVVDQTLKHDVHCYLESLVKEYAECLEHVFTTYEIVALGADSKADFMVEAVSGYYFIDTVIGEFLEPAVSKGMHGYLPTNEDYQTFCLMSGPNIKQGATFSSGRLIDHGPTLAHALGLVLSHVDGVIRYDVFKS